MAWVLVAAPTKGTNKKAELRFRFFYAFYIVITLITWQVLQQQVLLHLFWHDGGDAYVF